MNLIKAIKQAYKTKEEKQWPKLFWAIDLHGVCLNSNYANSNYTFINDKVVEALQLLQQHSENELIIWSSRHDFEKPSILDFFAKNGINIKYFNTNPLVNNTITGDFTQKFYFNILLDDKAGFDPDIDWQTIIDFYKQ